MPSKTKENYLKAIFSLSLENSEVALSDISKELGVSVPTVNSMVKKLKAEKWVSHERYRPLKLTAKGKRLAASIIRKHRLTEMFLVQLMGFGWEEVHDIAEEMEHIDNEQFFDRMDELLNHPSMDPHGSPIPTKDGSMAEQHFVPLSECEIGERYRLCALNDSSADLLRHLNEQSIALGQELHVLKIEAFDKSMRVEFAKNDVRLITEAVTQCLMVEKI